jgi:hypothetical protein
MKPVLVIAGVRTPFAKAGTAFAGLEQRSCAHGDARRDGSTRSIPRESTK